MVDDLAVVERGVLTAPAAEWDLAVLRAEVIRPLAEQGAVGLEAADAAAARLGVSRRQVYVLVSRWRAGEGLPSDLLPGTSGGGRGGARLADAVEVVVREVLRTRYLTRQRRTVAAVCRDIARECKIRGLPAPSRGTVLRRIAGLDPVRTASARLGAEAVRTLRSAGGTPPEVTGLLERVQIDHTPVDVIVVDEQHRLPIGRPYITIEIDMASRCVAGMVVTLEAPSATSAGLCLAHMAVDKRPELEQLGVQAVWPMTGKPRELYLGNASEFHSEALRRGCEQHGIKLEYRPPGQPHFGGIVERVIGTMMQMVHELPGTTFSNPAARGGYDSDRKAVLTLRELQRWLALAVACYHGEVHDTLGRTPAGVWAEKAAADGPPATVTNATAFLVDFLPVIRRIPVPYRVRDRPRAVLLRRAQAVDRPPGAAGKVRAAPRPARHLRIWALDPDGNAYLEVGYRTLSRPPISLWEQQAAVARLRERDGPKWTRTRCSPWSRRYARSRRKPQPVPARPGETGSAAPSTPPDPDRRRGRPTRRCRRGRGSPVRGDRAVVTADLEMSGPEDLSHLHPSARPVARLPDAERLRHVLADRWIGYTRATPRRWTGWRGCRPGRPSSGCRTAADRADQQRQVDDHREVPARLRSPRRGLDDARLASRSRWWSCRCPPTRGGPLLHRRPRGLRLAGSMRAAGCRPRAVDLEQPRMWCYREDRLRILVIDELHNMLAGRGAPRGDHSTSCVPGQRAAHPAGRRRHPGRLPGGPLR